MYTTARLFKFMEFPMNSFWCNYLRVRPVEAKIYKYLGVKIYKKIVPTSGDIIFRLIGARWIKGYSRISLETYRTDNIGCEIIHLFFFCLYLPPTFMTWQWLTWTIFNIFVNIYPIMTQRYLRFRVDTILAKGA